MAPRLEDAQCAICMDRLFDLRDDLDEVLPIATPDCGHVFHENCLISWFRHQADAYIAQMGDQGVDVQLADAPAECPECRTECYADNETGAPAIHRLFINFTSEGRTLSQAPASSQHVPSSPSVRWRSADKDVLGLARRARGITAEVEVAGAESHEDDVRGTIRRAEALRADSVSSKATEGFKRYVGGLTVALNRLTARLEEHPLINTLEGRLEDLQNRLADAERENARATTELQRRMGAELERLLTKERAKAAKNVTRAQQDSDVMQRDLEKAQIALRRARASATEREDDLNRKLAEAQRRAECETEERERLQRDLADRTKSVKMWRGKAEKRGQLRGKLEELQAENERLRVAGAAARTSPRKSQRESPERQPDSADDYELEDDTLPLEIEYPPLDMDDLTSPYDAPKRSTTSRTFALADSPPRRSATARTFAFGMDSPSPVKRGRPLPEVLSPSPRRRGPPNPSIGASRGGPGGSRIRTDGVPAAKGTTSRYFSERRPNSPRKAGAEKWPEVLDDSPPTKKRGRDNGGDARSSASRVLVEDSSPLRPREVIEVGSSPVRVPERPPKRAEPKRAGLKREPSILDFLGFETRGKQRGVVTGAKVRRRA